MPQNEYSEISELLKPPKTTVPSGPMPDITLPNMRDVYNQVPITDNPDYGDIAQTIKAAGSLPMISDLVLPTLKSLLAPGGQATNPYAKALEKRTQANVSAAQSDMMKRGLTGSDIEASALVGARGAGEEALAQFYGQTAGTLAQSIQQIVSGDIASQRENLLMLAQLMGQKISGDRDIAMFKEQLSATMAQASSNRQSALWGAGLGAIGSVGGGLAMGWAMSDRRLKTNLRFLERVAGVNIYRFNWNALAWLHGAPKESNIGVMAQEVREVHPELVGEDEHGGLTVKYSGLPAGVFDAIRRYA